jgi:hypothetical protein
MQVRGVQPCQQDCRNAAKDQQGFRPEPTAHYAQQLRLQSRRRKERDRAHKHHQRQSRVKKKPFEERKKTRAQELSRRARNVPRGDFRFVLPLYPIHSFCFRLFTGSIAYAPASKPENARLFAEFPPCGHFD